MRHHRPITTGAAERPHRSRWAAVGAAVAVTLGGGGILTTSASISSGERGVFVPITPCRLLDTRAGSDNVGPRSTALGEGETYAAAVHGTNGNCTIPSDAIGISMNVAIIQPSAASFLTVFPADATRPLAANLNWVAGQAPTPNAVTADLSADGRIAFYNLSGTVHLAADINGYYVDHNHDDRYYTKAQLAAPTDGNGGIGVLERMTNLQVATQRWDQDPARRATFTVGSSPVGLVFDGRWVWAASRGSDTVTKIDPRSNTVVATIATAYDPSRLAFDGAAVWVAHYGSNKVSKIDPATNAVTSFDLPGGPYAIVFDGSAMWIALWDDAKVVKIRPDTNQVLATVDVGLAPYDITFDGTNVWTANQDGHSLTRVNVSTSVATNVALGGAAAPVGIVFDGMTIWYVDADLDHLKRVDPASLVVSAAVALPAGSGAYFPAFDGHRIWVPAYGNSTISVVDVFSHSVTTIPTASTGPAEMMFDGTNMWVSYYGDTVVEKLPPLG